MRFAGVEKGLIGNQREGDVKPRRSSEKEQISGRETITSQHPQVTTQIKAFAQPPACLVIKTVSKTFDSVLRYPAGNCLNPEAAPRTLPVSDHVMVRGRHKR